MIKPLLSILASTALVAAAQEVPFPPVLENFYDQSAYPADLNEVMIPASPLKYQVLFTGGVDEVTNANGESTLAKEWQDFTAFVPIDGRSDLGYVVVNHERVQADPILGDGGGMTVFKVQMNNEGVWEVVEENGVKYRNVDFSEVGGTGANCGGIQTPWGQVWTAEEWGSAFASNETIFSDGNGITDTSDFMIKMFNGEEVNQMVKKHMNFQYMVEIDVENAKAVRKNYNMGRYDHEGGWVASDRKTVYLTDDKSSGSCLFRFVADQAEDFSKGQLYAYQQSNDGLSGSWLEIPMTLDNMMNARAKALELGATVFMRLEWIEGVNDNTIFITETGRGKAQDVSGAINQGGKLVKHLADLDAADGTVDNTFNDVFGRILRLDVASGKIEPAIEGGGLVNADNVPTGNHLSSPDGLTSTVIDGRTYLVIQEDMNPSGLPANPAHFSNVLNEIYWVDITGDAPGTTYSVDIDLHRFLVGPKGCETTGGRFTPDGMTFFINIQHPSSDNEYPFNHSVTMAVTGFDQYLSTANPEINDETGFNIYPNPASREVYFSQAEDVALYDINGNRIMVRRNTTTLDISSLASGTYIIMNANQQIQKLIVE